jgi:ribosomal-protein-alanine N-acetyltransferase
MSRWTVEPLSTLNDLDAVLDIEQESFTNPWTRDMYVAEIARADVSFVFLARDSDRHIVGFCSFWLVATELHLNNLAVRPAWRRQRVAAALLDAVLAEGRRRTVARVYLEVRDSNESARRLYDRFGFAVVGVRRGYYSHPVEDALMLAKDLSAP